MTEPQDSTNEQCPDYGSHSQNAYDTFMDIAQRRLSDDELTADDHEWIDAMAEREYRECEGHGSSPTDAHLARARYLGADAALAAAASLTMSESDAADFLDGDGSHDLRERYLSDGEPNLSGEWADDPTPYSLAVDILGMDGLAQHEDGEIAGRLATAWEEGRDAVWPDAVTAFARRITGDIGGALALERSCEAYVDSLRRL